MKKLAIIGSSNSFIKGSYGDLCKRKFGDDCDVFAIGNSDITIVLMMLLMNDISDKYEHVLIQFNPNDAYNIINDYTNEYFLISILIQIFKLFENSKSTLSLVILNNYHLYSSHFSYLARSLAEIFNIGIIDIESDYLFIDPDVLMPDQSHYTSSFYKQIFQKILVHINEPKLAMNHIQNDIEFSLLSESYYNFLKCEIKGTSWIKLPVYELSESQFIRLPDDKCICGIIYWTLPAPQYMIYSSSSIKMFKNLCCLPWTNLFLCRAIGYSFNSGLFGGKIEISRYPGNCIHEPMPVENPTPNPGVATLPFNSILVCDQAPCMYGKRFYNQYLPIFLREQKEQIGKHMRAIDFQNSSLFYDLEDSCPGCGNIFYQLLKMRPDVVTNLGILSVPQGKDNRATRLVLWAWRYGIQEEPYLASHKEQIKTALSARLNPPESDEDSRALAIAILIKEDREDLKNIDINLDDGRRALLEWFNSHGKYEYNLDKLND